MNRWSGSRLALVASAAVLAIALYGTSASAISIFAHVRVPGRTVFDAQVELQGIYDESTQVYGPAMTDQDIGMFNEVVYAPDWVFIDLAGRTFSRAAFDARRGQAPEPDSVIERIEKLSAVSGGLTALVTSISVHQFVDTKGRYGRPGLSHTFSEMTPYRDNWIRAVGGWKMKSREQVGPTKSVLDKPLWGM